MDADKKPIIRSHKAQSKKPSARQVALNPKDPTRIDYFKEIVETLRDPLVVLDKDLRVLSANRSFYEFFKVKAGETVGACIYDLGNRQWDIPALRNLLETILPQKAVFNDYIVEHDFPLIGKRSLLLNARRIPAAPQAGQWILLAFEDISERRQAEETIRELARFPSENPNPVLRIDRGGKLLYANEAAFVQLAGWKLAAGSQAPKVLKNQVREVFETGKEKIVEISCGERVFVIAIEPTPARKDVALYGNDITGRKQAEEERNKSQEAFAQMFKEGVVAMALSDVEDGTIFDVNNEWLALSGFQVEDVIGKNAAENGGWKNLEDRLEMRRLLKDQGEVRNFEAAWIRQSGEEYIVSMSARTINLNGKQYLLSSAIDITERKQAEQARIESEERFRSLFKNMMNGFAYCRMFFHGEHPQDFMYIEVNKAFETLTGLKNVTGKRVSQVIPGLRVTDPGLFEIYGRVALTGTPETFETYVEAMKMWFSVKVYSPRRKYFVAVFDVITERKQMENKLRESEKKYRELFMQMENGAATHAILCDARGNASDYITLDVNNAYESLLNVKKETVVGKKASEILPKEELQKWVGIFGPVALTGIPTRYEMYSPLNQRYFEGSAYRMERGKFAVTFSDITERKLADEKLAQSQKLLQDITDNSTNLIYALDRQGKFLLINRRLESVFGVPREKMIGKTREGVMPPEFAAAHRANDRQVLAQGQPMEYDEVNQERDGSHTYLSVKFPLFDVGGNVYGIGGISTDITDRQQAEKQIRQLNVTLERRVEERTNELREAHEQLLRKEKLAVLGQLSGSVGHELRNPLGVISNSVYYLKLVQPEASDKIRQHLATIEEQTRNAAKIVGDLLDYARVITAERESVPVDSLLNRTLERFPVPEEIELRLEMPEEQLVVFADPLQMEQVLGNLVTNAWQAMVGPSLNKLGTIRLGRGKKLMISARWAELSAGQPAICIQVKDTGMGIGPEHMQKLFEPLFSTKTQGIGLGLAVSRKLVEANGGRIEVESEIGQGSTFTLYLPVGDRG